MKQKKTIDSEMMRQEKELIESARECISLAIECISIARECISIAREDKKLRVNIKWRGRIKRILKAMKAEMKETMELRGMPQPLIHEMTGVMEELEAVEKEFATMNES